MQQYLDLLQTILDNGAHKEDRTGVGTTSVFAHQMRFDLQQGFPLLTTKKVHIKSFVHELLWFLSGETNVKYLQDNGVRIWNEWADENGELGPVYGKQWRHWQKPDGGEVDQISALIEGLKNDPDSRRHLVVAWNVGELDKMALPPCHMMFQFYVVNNKLSCQLYQRSADVFLGVPFNISCYSLLTHMVAQQCGYEVGEFVWTSGDAHIYDNHHEQVALQLTRKPYPLSKLEITRKPDSIFDYTFDDFVFHDYQCHPLIKGKVAV